MNTTDQRNFRSPIGLLTLLAALAMLSSGCIFVKGLVAPIGGPGALGSVLDVSSDGQFVLFRTATGIDPGDTNGVFDIYRYDTATDTTDWVSPSNLFGPGNADAGQAAISGDGKVVAFSSAATNLILFDVNGQEDIFVRDVGAGTTTRVAASNGPSRNPDISSDGDIVVFNSFGNTLVPGDINGRSDVFSLNQSTGVIQLISRTPAAPGNGHSGKPSLSEKGTSVAYESVANNLVPGDINGVADIFVFDFNLGTTVRVSTSSTGSQGNGASSEAAISADGSHVAFQTNANNLIPADTNGVTDIMVKDMLTATLERVSVDSAGAQASSVRGVLPSISRDGDAVVFRSDAPELNGGFAAGFVTVAHDRSAGTTDVMNTNANNAQTDIGGGNLSAAFRSVISDDGHYVTVVDFAGARPTTDPTVHWLRFRTNPTVTGLDIATLPTGSTSPVVVTGTGFTGTATVQTDLLAPGSDGIVFTNVEVVDDTTITADVDTTGAAVGARDVYVVIEGTGTGEDAALARCPNCFGVTP